jgi:TolB protein
MNMKNSQLPVPQLPRRLKHVGFGSSLGIGIWVLGVVLASLVAAYAYQQPASQQPAAPAPQQPSEIAVRISGDPGTPPRYAVPDFVALTPDAAAIAKTIGQVLWDDFAFERDFYMIPRDTYSTVPAARSVEQIPFDSWRQLGTDAVVFGTVQKTGNQVRIEVRLFNVRTRQSVFSKEYSGTDANPRLYAHTMADEIHLQQAQLRGVARTKLAFTSDRNRESLAGPVANREVKEIYMADYDGANVRRITTSRQLNINPAWSPDARALAYTTYTATLPDIFISYLYRGVRENPTKGRGSNFLPVWSPDGTRIAFMSNRDGNPEIYTMNVDGSNVRRITNHPAADVTPTWSPTGTQIAFTSDRAGRPQIYIVGADGLNLRRLTTEESYADRPTWSPAPFNEIAFSASTGPGYDIKVYDLATGMTRQITFGEGTNESPAYSPNGRHLAFSSTRAGRVQVFTITRDGRDVKQITREGNNSTPAWSN